MKTILSRVSLIIFAFLFWLALLAGVAFVRERPGPGDAQFDTRRPRRLQRDQRLVDRI